MSRTLLCCALLAALAFPCRAEQASPPTETLIRLSVTPARVPRPALKYLLLPELNETNPGNPCLGYLKCFMGQQEFFFDEKSAQRREKLLDMPLKDLPAQELLDYGGFALHQADWAARLDAPDWQILLKLKIEGPAVLLPDVQQFRSLAIALKVRFRAEVALGRFEDAVRTAKTMFAMARHLSEHPTLIGNIVGVAVAELAIGPLEEMLGQPGVPNLYWGLTNLPSPLVPYDKGIGGERDIFLCTFRDLDERAPMSEDQLKRFIAPLDGYLDGRRPIVVGATQAWLDARTKDKSIVDAARRYLIEYGFPEARVKEFPPEQVVLLDAKREYEVRRDEIFKFLKLPMWQAIPLAAEIKPGTSHELFADPFLEALLHINQPQARLDQRIALLRHVKALRLYAASHDGALPGKLSEISVPLPVDPFTGKPFRYELKDGTAHLRGSPPPGEEKTPAYNVHYEITVRKPQGDGFSKPIGLTR